MSLMRDRRQLRLPGRTVSLLLTFLPLLAAPAAPRTEKQAAPVLDARVQRILSELPESAAFTEWLTRTGELPPDFDHLPSHPDLPDPFTPLLDQPGGRIGTRARWESQRSLIREQFQHWMLGTMPPPPDTILVQRLQAAMEWDAISRKYQLSFGPDPHRPAVLHIETFQPGGSGPFPVFLTQANHRAWARIALERGYLAVVYDAADIRDDAARFGDAYPGYDWALLAKRAWAASRVIDFLETNPDADTSRIAIAGHSRNGKQALIAAAFDDRIDAVISSSSGAGGAMPWRLSTEYEFAESIERLTREFPAWFHPRLRFFAAREDRLPLDMNLLLALIAPRPCLISTAINDGVEQSWAIQQSIRSARNVYALYDADDAVGVQWRPGGHDTHPETVQRYFDWLRAAFDNRPADETDPFLHPDERQNRPLNATFSNAAEANSAPGDLWSLNNGRKVKNKDLWISRKWEIQQAIRRSLGLQPPDARGDQIDYGSDPDYINLLLDRGENAEVIVRSDLVFGDYISGTLYYDPAALAISGKLPGVLWLHPANNPRGYAASYTLGGQFYRKLAKSGYAVFCFDMIGYGRRVDEDQRFYDRCPDWSLLGKMIWDAQAALDRMSELRQVDPKRIYIAGYGLGAWVGLHTAALDDRPAGLVAIAPPGPFEIAPGPLDSDGFDHLAGFRMLQPQLEECAARGQPAPYDLAGLIACCAPKPLLILQPELNWRVDTDRQRDALEKAKRVYALYDAKEKCEFVQPRLTVALDPPLQQPVVNWLDHQTRSNSTR